MASNSDLQIPGTFQKVLARCPSTRTTWAATRPEPFGSNWFRGNSGHWSCWHFGPIKNNSAHRTSHRTRITAGFITISGQKAYDMQSTWQAKQLPPVQCRLQETSDPWAAGTEQESRDAQARGREDTRKGKTCASHVLPQ